MLVGSTSPSIAQTHPHPGASAVPHTAPGAAPGTGGHCSQQSHGILTEELPSVPVGQGETGPSYPGRYKAHRCKCREHLQWPPRSGSTRLPAGSSRNTAAGRTRELTNPTHTTSPYFPLSKASHPCPGWLSHLMEISNPTPNIQSISSNSRERKLGQHQPVQTQPSSFM